MKTKILYLIILSLVSCNKTEKKPLETESTGKINTVSIVINDLLWNGEVGDSLRKKFAAPVDGLMQEEPLFTINQYPIKALDGNKILSRNLIIVKKEDKNEFIITQNEYASPQNAFHISGNNNTEILQHIEKQAGAIIKNIKKSEIVENQKKIAVSLLDDKKIRKKFKIRLNIPSTFKYVSERPNFLWLKREILSGNNSILIYSAPFRTIFKTNDFSKNILNLRDSIVGKHIHSKVKNSKMITEEAYSPYFIKTILNNKRCWETKGSWEIKGDYMSGPFINYAIMDRKKRRFLIIEGFCYAPSTEKRDLMFELEAIIKSVKFLK